MTCVCPAWWYVHVHVHVCVTVTWGARAGAWAGVHSSPVPCLGAHRTACIAGGALERADAPMSGIEERVILHIDADSFFLAVHARESGDSSLLGRSTPIVLWQYNDVVCASHAARALGVQKHMTPEAARSLIEPHGGRLIHAYWREWPGPRIWYGRYNQASRDLIAALRALKGVAGAKLERASIDEAYVDVTSATAGSVDEGVLIARSLLSRTSHIGLPLSVGVGPNRLLAKLCSMRAKVEPSSSGGGGGGAEAHVYAVRGGLDVAALLSETSARKLPSLGSKADALTAMGVSTVADLQKFGHAELQSGLGLTAAAAQLVYSRSRGDDASPVREVVPQSCTVTSWLAADSLRAWPCAQQRPHHHQHCRGRSRCF